MRGAVLRMPGLLSGRRIRGGSLGATMGGIGGPREPGPVVVTADVAFPSGLWNTLAHKALVPQTGDT